MAQVVNWSRAPVEVYGEVPATGELKRWILDPKRQTAATFDCFEVRAAEGAGAEIFSGEGANNGWWRIHTAYGFVYTFSRGWFTDTLSLHCVPFLPAAGTDPPWRKGYEAASPDPARDSLPLEDVPLDRPPEHSIASPDTALDDTLGELEVMEEADFSFGRQVRTRMGTDVYLTVRLLAQPHWSLSRAEVRQIDTGSAGALSNKDLWKMLIEKTWALAKPSSNGDRLHFEVDWVDDHEHYSTLIISADQARQRGPFKTTYEVWPVTLDAGKAGPQDFPVCAHEFGHHLGLNDGYVIDLELPHLLSEAPIQALLAPKQISLAKTMWGYVDLVIPFWQMGKDRAQRRLAGNACMPPGDIMDDQFGRDQQPRNQPVIDEELVNALVQRRPQGLCYAARQFTKFMS